MVCFTNSRQHAILSYLGKGEEPQSPLSARQEPLLAADDSDLTDHLPLTRHFAVSDKLEGLTQALSPRWLEQTVLGGILRNGEGGFVTEAPRHCLLQISKLWQSG